MSSWGKPISGTDCEKQVCIEFGQTWFKDAPILIIPNGNATVAEGYKFAIDGEISPILQPIWERRKKEGTGECHFLPSIEKTTMATTSQEIADGPQLKSKRLIEGGQAMTDSAETKAPETPKPKRQRKPKEPAAITIPAPTKKPWELTQAEVDLVKGHIAKGASDSELQFCLGVARRYKLDPFRGQIWFVKRRDKSLDRYDKATKEKITGYRWIPIVGINGLLHIAARDHKKYFGSISKISYGPMIDVEWTEWEWVQGKPVAKGKHKLKVPEWAEVNVYKKGDPMPTVGQVFWEEIYPDITNAPLVRQMPRLMLGKCATAQAVRKAYPATDGLYVQEEFMVEPYEPSEQAKLTEAKVSAIDERIAKFKELSGGKMPTEEQCGFLERGQSPEKILLQASVPKPEQKTPVEAPTVQQSTIWPAGEKHSTERPA